MEKANKKFMLLSALGIFFVLDDHSGTSIGVFTNIFPYNSFYMPMFVFISGYFFSVSKLSSFRNYIFAKTKHFVIPFLKYNIMYLILSIILTAFWDFKWFIMIPPLQFITYFFSSILTTGTPIDICSSLWFVSLLFFVVITYALLRKIIFIWNEVIAFLLFICIGVWSVYIAHNKLYSPNLLILIKIGFFIPFYQFGIIYKNYIEKYNRKYPIPIILICIGINIFLIYFYGDKINFYSCAFMQGFLTSNYFLPFITSTTGILFWTTIMEYFAPVFGKNAIINFISNHTFFIMANHLFFDNILNAIFALFKAKGFNYTLFKETAWYKYLPIPQVGIIYIAFALFCTFSIMKRKRKLFKITTWKSKMLKIT